MMKRFVTLLLACCLALSMTAMASGAFDQSLFLESDGFINQVDPTVNVGSITYRPDAVQPIGQVTSEDDYFHFIQFDIFFMPGAPAVLRGQFAVAGTLVNADTITLWVEDTAYTLPVDSKASTSAYETVMLTFSSPALAMLKDILEKEADVLPFLLDGDFELKGDIPLHLEALQQLYDLYEQAGGLAQDFAAVDEKYPVTVVPPAAD